MKKTLKFSAYIVCILLFAVSCTQKTTNSESEQNLPTASPIAYETPSVTNAPSQTTKEIFASDLETIKNEFSEVGRYSYDMDNDGADEDIILTINANKNSKGEFDLGDGHDWQLYVKKGEKCYMLIDEYVQLGAINFDVMDYYTGREAVPTITATTKTSAVFKLTAFTYSSEKGCYIERELYNAANEADGGINKMFSSQKEFK